jgi:hypothetical protein
MFKLIRKIIVLAILALLLANLSSRAEAGLIKSSLMVGVELPSDYAGFVLEAELDRHHQIWMAAKKMSHMNQ